MPSLYNCRHDGDQYRITKFNTDWNVEASYLCDLTACECPAGHRPKCRHREMLPKFIQRGHIGDEWFYDHDRGGWVQGASRDLEEQLTASAALPSEPEPSDELILEDEDDDNEIELEPSLTIATEITLPADATPDEVAEAFGNLLAPKMIIEPKTFNETSHEHDEKQLAFYREAAGLGQASEPIEQKNDLHALRYQAGEAKIEPSPIPTIRRRI